MSTMLCEIPRFAPAPLQPAPYSHWTSEGIWVGSPLLQHVHTLHSYRSAFPRKQIIFMNYFIRRCRAPWPNRSLVLSMKYSFGPPIHPSRPVGRPFLALLVDLGANIIVGLSCATFPVPRSIPDTARSLSVETPRYPAAARMRC